MSSKTQTFAMAKHSLPESVEETKEYCITWKNPTPDEEGFILEKTMMRCDPTLIDALVRCLPVAEKELVCLTDQRDEMRKQEKIAYLEIQLKKLRGEIVDSDEGESVVPMGDMSDIYRQTDVTAYTNYFIKPGTIRDYYEKEETRRVSRRSLLIDDVTRV